MTDRPAHWRRLMAGSALFLLACFLVPRIAASPELDENRLLAGPPAMPRDPAGLRAFHGAADAYVADHFPPRAQLIGTLNYLRYRAGVSGSSRVIVGRDGWLYYDNGSHMGAVRGTPRLDEAAARAWLDALAGRSEALRARNIAYLVLVAPDKEAVYPQHAPVWFRPDPDRAAIRLPRAAAQAHAGEVLYPAAEIRAAAQAGVKAYSPYETHWTGLGAYEAYAALMSRLQAMGVTGAPRPLSAFAYVAHTRGRTPRNLALMLGIASFVPIDHPEVEDPAMDGKLTTTWLTHAIDWTKPRVVDTDQLGKPVLLITMDSFSTALLPYLYGDFSRIIIAHNQDGAWRGDLIERFKPDVVVTEVVESGLAFVMGAGPEPSADATARIAAALAHPLVAPEPPRRTLRRQAGPQPARPLPPAPVRAAREIYGGPGDDLLDGGDEPDTIYGRGGADTIHGRGGNDILRGGKGNDVIDGGDGDDAIWGDKGDDTLTGGRGADSFHAAEGADLDLVLDYNPAEGDRVIVDGGAPYTVRQVGPDTVIELRGSRMVLKGVKLARLPRGWILSEGRP